MEMMMARSMRVHVAFNGQDGYDKAVLLIPDLILLDVSMPIMDGFATCRMLKNNELTRYIPVIFLTASNDMPMRIEGLSLGAVDYIGKPFNEQEVIMRVEIHLNLMRREVARLKEEVATPALMDGIDKRDLILLRSATDYLLEHIAAPPSPKILAKLLGTNEKRLSQTFQSGFAMPIFTWLREERLRQARELLALSMTSIASIAEHLGYSSPANFSKAFQERFGCSPRELRRQIQHGLKEAESE